MGQGLQAKILDLSSDDDIQGADLIKPEIEDSDFRQRRSEGMHSRTEEIAARLEEFFHAALQNTSINLDPTTLDGRNKIEKLTSYISNLCRNERPQDEVKSFISYAKRGEMLCSVLLGAGIMELKPKPGDVFCHPDTGIWLSKMARPFQNKSSVCPSHEQVEILSGGLTGKLNDEDSPIRRIFMPIELDNCHWGLVLMTRDVRVDGTEHRMLSFGDSLRFECPMYLKKFFTAVVDRCLPPPEGSVWSFEKINYILDVLGYEKQRDSHSCAAYVISAIAENARTRGCLPGQSFGFGYDSELTERYRWGCVEAKLANILGASAGNVVLSSSGTIADEHVQRTSRKFCRIRHPQRKMSTVSSGGKNSTKRPSSHQEDRSKNPSKSLIAVKGHQRSQTITVKRMRFNDSSAAVAGVIDDILDSVIVKSSQRTLLGHNTSAYVTECALVEPSEPISSSAKANRIIQDFPQLFYDLLGDGNAYGLHYCRTHKRKRRSAYLTLRLRCLKYIAPWKCKSAVTGRLRSDKKTWEMKYNLTHNHERTEIPKKERVKRVENVCGSILYQLPRDQLPELKPILSLKIDERSHGQRGGVSNEKSMQAVSECHRTGLTVEHESSDRFERCANPTKTDEQQEGMPCAEVPSNTQILQPSIPGNSGNCNLSDQIQEAADPGSNDEIQINEAVNVDDREAHSTAALDEVLNEEMVHSVPEEPTKPPPLEVRDGFFQHSEMLAAITSYVDGQRANAYGQNVLKQIKLISEGFGYKLFVRDSAYHDFDGGNCDARDDSKRVLKRATFKCLRADGVDGCGFAMIVKTVRRTGTMPAEDDDSNQHEALWRYICDSSRAYHCHEPEEKLLRKCLPPQTVVVATTMHNVLNMGYKDVLRYLQDTYHINIDSERMRQQLKYVKNKRSPRDEDCFRLLASLFVLQGKNPRHRVFFSTNGNDSMHSTAWVLEEWIEDYEKYGIIPGVSIDCRTMANRFSFPLMSINGRTPSGQLCTFFMGFVPSETEESFTWMLEKFLSAMPVSPGMVTVDQDAALITAVKKTMPNSFLAFDDWHLNKSQMKNVASWCASISRPTWCREMNADLFSMRRCNNLNDFNVRRKNFESKYFLAQKQSLPRWYSFLYRQNPSLVINYYKSLHMPMSFLFQGIGYSEPTNSMFRNFVLPRGVPIFDVPAEMLEVTMRRKAHLPSKLQKKEPYYRQLSSSSLGIPTVVLQTLCKEHTAYALAKFLDVSVLKSTMYKVQRSYITKGCQLPQTRLALLGISDKTSTEVAIFVVVKCVPSNEEESAQEYEVFCCLVDDSKSAGGAQKVLKGGCTCWKPTSNGFPCAHMSRISTVYAEEVSRTPELESIVGQRFALEHLWHPYWKTNSTAWTIDDIAALRRVVGWRGEALLIGATTSRNLGAQQNESSLQNGVLHETEYGELGQCPKELEHFSSWASIMNLGKQLYDHAASRGPTALRALRTYLLSIIDALEAGKVPLTSDIQFPSAPVEQGQSPVSVPPEPIPDPNDGTGISRKRLRGLDENLDEMKSQKVYANDDAATVHRQEDTLANEAVSEAPDIAEPLSKHLNEG